VEVSTRSKPRLDEPSEDESILIFRNGWIEEGPTLIPTISILRPLLVPKRRSLRETCEFRSFEALPIGATESSPVSPAQTLAIFEFVQLTPLPSLFVYYLQRTVFKEPTSR